MNNFDKINNDRKYIFQICLNVLGGLLFTALGAWLCNALIVHRIFVFFTLISPFILYGGIGSFFAVFGYERIALQPDFMVFKAVFGSQKRKLYYNDITEWEEIHHVSGRISWRKLILYTKNESETYEICSYLLFEANYIALKKLLTEGKPEKQVIFYTDLPSKIGIHSFFILLIPFLFSSAFFYFAWIFRKYAILNIYIMPTFVFACILLIVTFVLLYHLWKAR